MPEEKEGKHFHLHLRGHLNGLSEHLVPRVAPRQVGHTPGKQVLYAGPQPHGPGHGVLEVLEGLGDVDQAAPQLAGS